MVQTQEVVGERRVRRCRSVLEKRQIVQLMLELGASVAEVPRAHGVTANQMFAWRGAFERGRLTQPCSALLPASASFVRDAVLRPSEANTFIKTDLITLLTPISRNHQIARPTRRRSRDWLGVRRNYSPRDGGGAAAKVRERDDRGSFRAISYLLRYLNRTSFCSEASCRYSKARSCSFKPL